MDGMPQEQAGAGVLGFRHAREAVARHARVTPLLRDEELSRRVGRDVHLKAECLQVTGSFKVRGAAARLEALDDEERARGIVACSSGNHGRAVSYVAGRLGIPATIHVPEWVDPVKLEGIVAGGAEAVREGDTFDEAEALALERAASEGRTYVSAYDDPWVIAGQGTLAAEVLEQLGCAPSAFVVPLSGGGLIGGIAAALREADLPDASPQSGRSAAGSAARGRPKCIAASAQRAAVMLASVREGRPVELPEEETLANALAGGIGLDNRHSFDLVRKLVDAHVTVSEEEIASAMRYGVEHLRLVVEGGGAVGLAALLAGCLGAASEEKSPDEPEPRRGSPRGTALPPGDGPVVVILSGGNVAEATLVRVLGGSKPVD